MSEEFNIKRGNSRGLNLTREDFNLDNIDIDDINIDSLKDTNLDLESGGSDNLNFTKENMDFSRFKNIFGNDDLESNKSKQSNNSNKSNLKKNKKNTKDENKPNVNIKKKSDNENFFTRLENQKNSNEPKKKPIIEPNSIDLGLDILANQNKKIKEPSVDSNDNRSNSSLGEYEGVKEILNEKDDEASFRSEKSNDSRKSKSNISDLSSLVKEKISKRSHLTENQRKEELLFLFSKLEKKGFKLNQKFTMRSSLEDMELIYQRLEHERNLKNSIKFQRKVLMGIVSTLEFVNTSFNPFDVDLEGWSESIMENYNEYDDIFEELYEKYKDKGKISPEVRLLMTLAGSAFYFHLSKTIIRSGQQRMNELFGGGANESSNPLGGMGPMGGLMSGFMNNFMNAGANEPNETREKKEMKGPQGFDDILSNKSDDIPSIHSNDSQVKKKKKTLAF